MPLEIVRWINALLRSRTVTVTVQGKTVSKKVNKGCPLGDILSSLLWNLFINSLIILINSTPVDSEDFANDVIIIIIIIIINLYLNP